jgi:hypothetical protein
MVLHFVYSSQKPTDALHHQRQVLLRNSANPESGLLTLSYLMWSWRRCSSKPWVRLFAVTATALLCTAGFTVASGFSSRVSGAMGTEVLLGGQNCAIYNSTVAGTLDRNLDRMYRAKLTQNWANYAQQCYSSGVDASRLLECSTFVKQRLGSEIQTNASCPFHPSLCKSQNGNLLIDTGYLDSHDDFGINTVAQDRFQLRRVIHCAPLVTEGRTSQFNLTADRSYTQYYYGQTRSPSLQSISVANFTYEYTNDAEYEFAYTHGRGAIEDYSIGQDFPSHGVKQIVSFTEGSFVF